MVTNIPKVVRVTWARAFRVVRSIYPPSDPFEDIAAPDDRPLIASGEAKSDPQVRDESGEIALVPSERRVRGPASTSVMAAFAHLSRNRPTRFSDGTYGVYYAGSGFDVALHQTVYHFERFMVATDEPAMTADFRELVGPVGGDLHDLRGDRRFAACLDENDYSVAQEQAGRLRRVHESSGLVYPSLRCQTGEAIAAFWPHVVGPPERLRHLACRWNGRRADGYLVYGESDWRAL